MAAIKRPRRVKTPIRRKPAATPANDEESKSPRRTRRAAKSGTPKKVSKGFDRGTSGFKKAEVKRQRQEDEYERKKNTPWDFRLKPGDEAEVVVLDNQDPFFIPIHSLKDTRGKWTQDICIADTGQTCPLCEHLGKEGSYTMYLTVLDRRPYTIQSGQNKGKTVKVSKKLLPVKGRNLPKFQRQFERKFQKRDNRWRGLRIACHRAQEKESAIGEDIEFLGVVKEVNLKKFGDTAQPVNYEEIFVIPSAAELRKRYNLDKGNVAGSEEFDNEDPDYDLDNVDWGDDEG